MFHSRGMARLRKRVAVQISHPLGLTRALSPEQTTLTATIQGTRAVTKTATRASFFAIFISPYAKQRRVYLFRLARSTPRHHGVPADQLHARITQAVARSLCDFYPMEFRVVRAYLRRDQM